METPPNEWNDLDIPSFLKRDANNESEITKMARTSINTPTEETPAAVKAKPVKPVKGNSVVKAEAAPVKATKVAKPPVKAAKTAAKPAKAPAKVAKPKAEKAEVPRDAFGLKKGSLKSNAAAMYNRKNGATLVEVKDKLGSVQLNVLTELEAKGHTVEKVKEERKEGRAVTRYILKAAD